MNANPNNKHMYTCTVEADDSRAEALMQKRAAPPSTQTTPVKSVVAAKKTRTTEAGCGFGGLWDQLCLSEARLPIYIYIYSLPCPAPTQYTHAIRLFPRRSGQISITQQQSPGHPRRTAVLACPCINSFLLDPLVSLLLHTVPLFQVRPGLCVTLFNVLWKFLRLYTLSTGLQRYINIYAYE